MSKVKSQTFKSTFSFERRIIGRRVQETSRASNRIRSRNYSSKIRETTGWNVPCNVRIEDSFSGEGGGGKSWNLNIERRKEPNLSAELVRSRWKSIHVTRERKCAGKLLSGGHRRESEKEGGRVDRGGETGRARKQRERERERSSEGWAEQRDGGQRAHVLIKFSRNLGDCTLIRLKAFHRRTVTNKGPMEARLSKENILT